MIYVGVDFFIGAAVKKKSYTRDLINCYCGTNQ